MPGIFLGGGEKVTERIRRNPFFWFMNRVQGQSVGCCLAVVKMQSTRLKSHPLEVCARKDSLRVTRKFCKYFAYGKPGTILKYDQHKSGNFEHSFRNDIFESRLPWQNRTEWMCNISVIRRACDENDLFVRCFRSIITCCSYINIFFLLLRYKQQLKHMLFLP